MLSLNISTMNQKLIAERMEGTVWKNSGKITRKHK